MGIFSKKTEESSAEDVAQKTATKRAGKNKQSKNTVKKASKSTASVAEAYNAIIAPIVTEKSHDMMAKHKYVFRIANTVSKPVVKKIIEDMYGVTVKNVNIVVVKPKRRTVKQDRGYQKLYKKAIVTVSQKDHIAIFEGV